MIQPRFTDPDPTSQRIAQLALTVLNGENLSADQALQLTQLQNHHLYDLFYWANRIRIHFLGNAVKFCSIVAAKAGACSEDCGFCSQSAKHQTHVAFSKLSVDEINSAFEQARQNGASSFGIVNSGRGPTNKELDWLEPFFKQAASQGQVRPCATLGELTPEQAQRLKNMGVLRVNHNLETSRKNFPNIIHTHTYDHRLQTLRTAKQAGLSLCSGGIFGMGESWQDRIDMALELRSLQVDVVPINFLNAIPGTALYGQFPDLTPMQALHIVALYRFLLPTQELKVAGGREKILRDLQSWIFFAGASSFMIGNYLTTFGRPASQDHQMLKDLNLPYVTFDEVEHTADPAAALQQAPDLPINLRPTTSTLSLPVVS